MIAHSFGTFIAMIYNYDIIEYKFRVENASIAVKILLYQMVI